MSEKAIITDSERSNALPVIDLNPEDMQTEKIFEIACLLDKAFQTLGACRIKGLVPFELQEQILKTARRLHDLPKAEKERLHSPGMARRYMAYPAKEGMNNHHAALTVMFGVDEELLVGTVVEGPNRWPGLDPETKKEVEVFQKAMIPISLQVTQLMSIALGVEPKLFMDHFKQSTRFVRLHVYQPCQLAPVGGGEHTDHGCLTILIEDDVGGLQIQDSDGKWVDTPPVHGSVVANVGDVLEQWTNGRWRSVPHRAVHHPQRVRYSVPFFFDPYWHTNIEGLPTCVTEDTPLKYEPILYSEKVLSRWTPGYREKDDNQ